MRKTLIALSTIMITSQLSAKELQRCFNDAGSKFGVSPQVLRAIAKVESNFNSKALNHNQNGTTDIGVMQINSTWLDHLKQIGLTKNDLLDPCTNIFVGAWILSNKIKIFGQNWNAIGAYNVGTSTQEWATRKRYAYANKVFRAYRAD